MASFIDFAFREEYDRLKRLGDRLSEIEKLIDWEAFRSIVGDMYDNKTEKGGRPNIDEIMMIKALIWQELQRRLDSKRLKVKKGVIQDATFITCDAGHAKADKPRGNEAKTRRSRDGTWTKKYSKSYFGYKLHSKSDIDYGLVRDIEITTASVHDNKIDLTKPGEVAYKDKGYFGATSKGYNATMRRSVRGHPIGIKDILRNKRISKKRAPGERPYAVIKNIFKSGHTMVTTIARVAVKMVFASFGFNLFQLLTLKKQGTV